MRFPLEVFDAIRAVAPDDTPVGIRISATDWVDGGWDIEQSVAFAKELQRRGCTFIDVSSGGLSPRQQIPVKPGYQVPFAERDPPGNRSAHDRRRPHHRAETGGSHELNREKVIAGNGKATIYVGPLSPGKYPFFGEFNEKTARGVIVAE